MRRNCIDDIAKRTGRKRSDVEDILQDILDRAEGYERDGASADDAYARARDEKLAENAEAAARARRARIMDMRKDVTRRRFYATTAEAIRQLSPKLAVQAARLAMEATPSGRNLPSSRSTFREGPRRGCLPLSMKATGAGVVLLKDLPTRAARTLVPRAHRSLTI